MKCWLMNMEQLVERQLAEETDALGENSLQFHFIQDNSHTAGSGIEPGPPQSEGTV
jgi:hypothetical protein